MFFGLNDVFLHILKVQTLVTHPNVSLVPKNRAFVFLKRYSTWD